MSFSLLVVVQVRQEMFPFHVGREGEGELGHQNSEQGSQGEPVPVGVLINGSFMYGSGLKAWGHGELPVGYWI